MVRFARVVTILTVAAGPTTLASTPEDCEDGPVQSSSSIGAGATPSSSLPVAILAASPSSLMSPASSTPSASGAIEPATSQSSSDPSCPCGYTLTSHGGAYFQHHYALDFSTVPDQVGADADSLGQYGWIIRHNGRVGGANPDGVHCTGKAENIAIRQGVLELTMPGGQSVSDSKELFGAEMKFGEAATHGVFTVRGKVSKEPGACQAFWTEYHDKEAGNKDEQDLEILGQALMDEGTLGAGEYGLWMTNWDGHLTDYQPTDSTNERREHTTWHFPQDPSLDFHNYTIGWLNDTTHYFYDGTELNAPKQYSSVNPSDMTINCWSNGNKGWSQGPPANDVVLRDRSCFSPALAAQADATVSAVDFHYEKEVGEGPPDGCTLEQACKVG